MTTTSGSDRTETRQPTSYRKDVPPAMKHCAPRTPSPTGTNLARPGDSPPGGGSPGQSVRLTANQRQNPHLQEPRPSLLHQEVAGEADGLMNGAGRAVRLVFRLTVRSQRGPTHRASPHRPCALTQTCELGLYRVKVTSCESHNDLPRGTEMFTDEMV